MTQQIVRVTKERRNTSLGAESRKPKAAWVERKYFWRVWCIRHLKDKTQCTGISDVAMQMLWEGISNVAAINEECHGVLVLLTSTRRSIGMTVQLAVGHGTTMYNESGKPSGQKSITSLHCKWVVNFQIPLCLMLMAQKISLLYNDPMLVQYNMYLVTVGPIILLHFMSSRL